MAPCASTSSAAMLILMGTKCSDCSGTQLSTYIKKYLLCLANLNGHTERQAFTGLTVNTMVFSRHVANFGLFQYELEDEFESTRFEEQVQV